ncbi:MAG: MBL fold hydrolase [Thermodesulfobacterium geofontis]|uniref:MBL fold hydrolase n=1 Tax=Thermodesulfobacterium geofontis TaxID=1295609 RepID=A0A2N7Q9B1_9BACT|nr:MAG: MBL fold hydrolase [Thermodesulfobacterium geofontis]PMP94859.1 MAG: MBL fold hydrolase [Thermodesulfobacterium geofontis]
MSEILFLGTAGARYVVAKQLRASAGTVIHINNSYLLLDPGPGTLVHLAKRKIPIEKIETIVVSHQHLDHSADLNIMVDAITEGGFKKRGTLFLTESALKEGILLSYLHSYLKKIELLKPYTFYESLPFKFKTTCLLKHTAENYGLLFYFPEGKIVGFITDTAFFDGLAEEFAEANILVIYTVRYKPLENVLHLSISDVKKILEKIRPEEVILTHFGMTMLKVNPFKVAQKLSKDLGLKIRACYDGMEIKI